MEYLPRKRRMGMTVPFGWYVCPEDPSVIVPDQAKIDALEYAYKQRAKYNTPLRDCTMWLHAATGYLMTVPGFSMGYRRWVKKLAKERRNELQYKKKQLEKLENKLIAGKYFKYTVITDENDAISSVAHERLRLSKKAKKKKKTVGNSQREGTEQGN